ncbi:DUF1573 domain-containing protein [Luteolibacter pohnpeiensis]|uniref:DUF1573 domain-containing protein n=1 Tax=Luteolibacter pohnpeiensis TaxID=454153 RepID=A0A934VX69_9BACT|nr:DUF1573 domain-containing protein [Luteolibacter pohnpeiensis]MBK1883523.1 DUF1573 domain-containing protein [Luteolibacter pohnpeiensis]
MRFVAVLFCGILWVGFAEAAELKFEQPNQVIVTEYGQKETVVDFTFTNLSEYTETIEGVTTGCSCSSTELLDKKMEYAPGETGTIQVHIDVSGIVGESTKYLEVYLVGDDVAKPSASLSVKISKPELISLKPKTLKWAVGAELEPKTIEISVLDGQEVNLDEFILDSETFVGKLNEIKKGRKYELIVTPTDTSRAPKMGVILLKTDSKVRGFAKINAYAVIVQKAG